MFTPICSAHDAHREIAQHCSNPEIVGGDEGDISNERKQTVDVKASRRRLRPEACGGKLEENRACAISRETRRRWMIEGL
jgi:hypothetical protein